MRNKVTCNSLVICNAPLPLSWDQFVQYDTIVSWNFILLGPCELNFLTKRSKKRSCATSRSFIPFQGRYFRHVRKLPDEKLNLWRGKLIWRWIAAFRIVYCSFFLSLLLSKIRARNFNFRMENLSNFKISRRFSKFLGKLRKDLRLWSKKMVVESPISARIGTNRRHDIIPFLWLRCRARGFLWGNPYSSASN